MKEREIRQLQEAKNSLEMKTETEMPAITHTLDGGGNAWFAGKVSAGTQTTPAAVEQDNDLTTKKYVDELGQTLAPLDGPVFSGGIMLGDTNIVDKNSIALGYDNLSSFCSEYKIVASDKNTGMLTLEKAPLIIKV